MNTKITKQESLKNLNLDRKISKTGYRAMLLLTLLLKSPRSREEIVDCFQKDSFLGDSLSLDSVTNTINALRNIGCKINRPTSKTDYRYELVSHPFSSFLTQEDINTLQEIREIISTLGDWELIINLNKFYEKLSKYACDENAKNILLYNHKLKNINLNIIKELLTGISAKKQLNLVYYSPSSGKENLEFLPENITFENDKLYLWGYSLKYKMPAYLRIDRIKGINFIRISETNLNKKHTKNEVVEIVYALKNLSAILYMESEDEEIVSRNYDSEYSIVVKAKTSNKFSFFQKILGYGTDCKIISPDNIIEEFKQELKKIKAVYKDEN